MKKLIVSITVLLMLFGFTSCGNDENEPSVDQVPTVESTDEYIGGTEQDPVEDASDSFEVKQEVVDAAWDSGLFQVDDMLIQLPVRLDQWVNLGLDYEIDSGNKSKDYLFAQNEKVSLNLIYKGERLGSLIFTKQTETPETVQDMNPLIDKIYLQHKPANITVYFPGGLTFEDPYTSVEQNLGKATEIDEYMSCVYGYADNTKETLYGMKVFINRNDQVISGFEIGKSMSESDRESVATISFENVPNAQTDDVHNVSLLWAPAYVQIPGMTTMQRCADSVLNANGKKYYMSISFSMLSQNYASDFDYIEYGEPVFDVTDESGLRRRVYVTDYNYVVVCETDLHIFKAMISFKDMSDSSENALAVMQDLVFEIAESVQF